MNSTSVQTLQSIQDPRIVTALSALAVNTVVDLASFPPFRHAELLAGLDRNGADGAKIARHYLKADAPRAARATLLPLLALKSVTQAQALILRDRLRLRTVADAAKWPPFLEALRVVQRDERPRFSEPASAPDALIPTLIGSTHTASRFSSYVKERSVVIGEQRLAEREVPDDVAPRRELLQLFTREDLTFELGYLALVRQKWLNAGTHLGEIMHSLALAPGESRNIAVLDWTQRQRSSRDERTRADERLSSEFMQTRAINEVVSSTAREHLQGSTQVDATTRTTGIGVTGGIGGGQAQSQSAAAKGDGAALGALGALVGLPMLGALASGTKGKAAASNLASVAGGLGASYVHSKGTVQGTLLSETGGEREVLGEMVQNISDATVQNSSNVRSLMSTVVVEDAQSGRQRSQTRNITNYNHSHAMTMQYYEVLQQYVVHTALAGLFPVLYLPFRPLRFTIGFIKEYWSVLREPMRQAMPARFREYDQVVKGFDPRNNAFDTSSELTITGVEISSVRTWSGQVEVEMTDATPDVKLRFAGFRLDDTVDVTLSGASAWFSFKPLDDDDYSYDGDAIPVDAAAVFRLDTRFKAAFRNQLQETIEDATRNLVDTNRDFNQLGEGNNKKNLKDDVDNGAYRIMNPNDGVTLSMSFVATVEDANGNTETVTHEHSLTLTYGQLHSEVTQTLFSLSDVIRTALDTTADFNPLDTIKEIVDHFTLHRYGYTRFLLSVLEGEQVTDVIDHLAIAGDGGALRLSRLVDPSPLGVVDNYLIFKLRDLSDAKGEGAVAACAEYVRSLRASARAGERWDRTETVYLPTAGLFGEAILGRSNASEFLDIRRFFNWQDSPIPNAAPAIVAVDLNQRRANDVAQGLEATVPGSVLSQIGPTLYPMPTSLADALQAVQNGQMFNDMSKSAELTNVLSNLSQLANNTAQLAGTLSGDAMAKALDSAVALGGQVASMTRTAMSRTPATPPRTLTEKGSQICNIDHVGGTPHVHGDLSDLDEARISAGGTDVDPCDHGDDIPPSDTPTPTPDPGDGDTPEPPAPGTSLIRIPVEISVPYTSVRLDLVNAAFSVLPADVTAILGGYATVIGTWVYAIGFDDSGGFDVVKQALEALAIATPVVGEVVLFVEGLKAAVDFVGADPDVMGEAVGLAQQMATTGLELLQSLIFPALHGEEWLTAEVKVVVKDGAATATVSRWIEHAISYGWLMQATAAEGPWWAGDSWSAGMLSATRLRRDALQASASLGTDGALAVRVWFDSPLALNWPAVLAAKVDELVQQIRELMAVPTVDAGVAASLGVANAEAELVARTQQAFTWLTTNLVQPLQEAFTPEINFDFTVTLSDDGTEWAVNLSGMHDAFPSYSVSIKGPTDDDVKVLYSGPAALDQSMEGPFALLDAMPDYSAEGLETVPREWFVDWR